MSVIIKSSAEQTVLESSSLIYGHPVRRDSHWSVSCDAPGSRAADDPAARRREGLGPPCAAPHTARTLGHDAVARECSGPLRGQKAETTSKRTVSTPTVRCTLIPHPRKAQLHLRASPSPHPRFLPSTPPSALHPSPTHPRRRGSGLAFSPSPGLFWLCPQVSSPSSSDLSEVCLFVLKAISFLKRNSAIGIVNYLH